MQNLRSSSVEKLLFAVQSSLRKAGKRAAAKIVQQVTLSIISICRETKADTPYTWNESKPTYLDIEWAPIVADNNLFQDRYIFATRLYILTGTKYHQQRKNATPH